MKKRVYLVCLILIVSGSLLAGETEQVKALLKQKIDAVLVLLQKKGGNEKERDRQIINLVTPIFDFNMMGKLSLGKKHWPTLNKKEQQRFSDLFTKRLQESYLEKLNLYSDEKVIYNGSERVKNKIQILTQLVSADDKVDVLYKFYKSKSGSWLIYDLEIEGVSIIQTYRSQFDGVLKKGDAALLLSKLERKGEFHIPQEKKKK